MIDRLKNNKKILEFVRYVIVGIGATFLHYALYLILEYLLQFNYNIAYTIGYIVSFIFNFFASTIFTFKTKANVQNGVKFAGAHFINYILHMILLNTFIFIRIPRNIAPLFVFPIAIVINFFIVRLALKNEKISVNIN